MLTLFVFSTKDGWVKLMHNGIDAVGVDKEVSKTFTDFDSNFSNFILLLNTLNVTSTNLNKKTTCIWLAYSN